MCKNKQKNNHAWDLITITTSCRLFVNIYFPLKSYHKMCKSTKLHWQYQTSTCCQAKQRPKRRNGTMMRESTSMMTIHCVRVCIVQSQQFELLLKSVSFPWLAVLPHAVFGFGVLSNPQCIPDKPRCCIFVQTSCLFLICDLLYPVHVGPDSLLLSLKLAMMWF